MQPTPSVKPVSVPAAPQLEPHELEMKRKQELLQRVKVLRERMTLNRGMINNMSPDKIYVWVHNSDNRQIFYKGLGYELCVDPKVESAWKQADGTHRRGDLILYQIDKDLAEAIKLYEQAKALDNVDAAESGFNMAAQREGVPTYKPVVRRQL